MPVRMFIATFVVVIVIVTISTPMVHAQTPSTRPASRPVADVAQLIRQLADADPTKRASAEQDLLHLGRMARPAVLAAARTRGANAQAGAGAVVAPEIADRCRALLVRLPWDRPDDPPFIRSLLEAYRDDDADMRAVVARTLIRRGGDAGATTALRLMVEEPDAAVRWRIVGAFRDEDVRPDRARCGALVEARDDAPALALAGWCHEPANFPRAMELYQQAVDADARAADAGEDADVLAGPARFEMDFVFETLLNVHRFSGRPAQAADAARHWHRRTPDAKSALFAEALPVELLFAVHADFGAQPGFAQDVLDNAHLLLARPQLLYCVARVIELRGWQRTAQTIASIAFEAGGDSSAVRRDAGVFLSERGYNAWARRELLAALRCGDATPSTVNFVQMRLGWVEAAEGDEAAAAEHLLWAVKDLPNHPMSLHLVRDGRPLSHADAVREVTLEGRYYAIRAANARHDKTAAANHALAMIALEPYETRYVNEAVPALLAAGHVAEARAMFDRAYAAAHDWLEQSPQDVQRMNNLAWLCACCNQRLDEAADVARRATELAPNDWSVFDTLAEIQERRGRLPDALSAAKRAAELVPGYSRVKDRVAHLEAAVKAASQPAPATTRASG